MSLYVDEYEVVRLPAYRPDPDPPAPDRSVLVAWACIMLVGAGCWWFVFAFLLRPLYVLGR